MTINKGKLTSINGSWGSGLLSLEFWNEDTDKVSKVYGDNAPTIRLLEGICGDVIADGHTFNPKAVVGKEFYWCLDEMGLTLGGLCLVEDANPEAEVAYQKSLKREKVKKLAIA